MTIHVYYDKDFNELELIDDVYGTKILFDKEAEFGWKKISEVGEFVFRKEEGNVVRGVVSLPFIIGIGLIL